MERLRKRSSQARSLVHETESVAVLRRESGMMRWWLRSIGRLEMALGEEQGKLFKIQGPTPEATNSVLISSIPLEEDPSVAMPC